MNNFVKTFLGFCFALCFAQAAFSATYTVTKIADTNDGACDADCSLREAVAAAAATVDNDTIQFSALFNQAQTITLSGTILLSLPTARSPSTAGNESVDRQRQQRQPRFYQ
jgi:CSLREA domain-containing protein